MVKKKDNQPRDIFAARQARAAMQGAPVPPAAEAVPEEKDTGGPEEVAGSQQIPYTIGDLFAALGEANWNAQLLQRQVQILTQQVQTYKNIVKNMERVENPGEHRPDE